MTAPTCGSSPPRDPGTGAPAAAPAPSQDSASEQTDRSGSGPRVTRAPPPSRRQRLRTEDGAQQGHGCLVERREPTAAARPRPERPQTRPPTGAEDDPRAQTRPPLPAADRLSRQLAHVEHGPLDRQVEQTGSASPGFGIPGTPPRVVNDDPSRRERTSSGQERHDTAEIHGPGDAHSARRVTDRPSPCHPDPAWILLLRLANVIDELVHAEAHDRIRPTGPVEPGQRHTRTVGRNDDVHPKRVSNSDASRRSGMRHRRAISCYRRVDAADVRKSTYAVRRGLVASTEGRDADRTVSAGTGRTRRSRRR